MQKQFKALIWDADGVLFDSPTLACKAAADYLTANGHPVSLEQYQKSYLGKSFARVLGDIREKTGQDLTSVCTYPALLAQQKEVFSRDLKASPNVEALLQYFTAAKLPMAVASDSDAERLAHTLGVTGLDRYFGEHVYNGDMVAARKPAPDIFLLAAHQLGVAPEDCLVIEDGISGIQAAKAAGMSVYAYLGASHMTEFLRVKTLNENPDFDFMNFSNQMLWRIAQPSRGNPSSTLKI